MTLHESSLRIILRDNFKGGFFMSEKMLVTQALDERDLLVKKISDKIDKATVSTMTNLAEGFMLISEQEKSGKVGDVKTSDAKLFLIKLQQDGKRYSTVKTVRGVLRPAFQMAMDDDVLHKNPFGFELAGGW